MYWLTDSRHRLHTGKRFVYRFPETRDGVIDVWHHVIMEECPEEYADYIGLANGAVEHDDDGTLYRAVDIFNDYWGVYGWNLAAMEDDARLPDDCENE